MLRGRPGFAFSMRCIIDTVQATTRPGSTLRRFRRRPGYISPSNTAQSGKAMARTGLRMMPTSPSPPLKFRTAGFPQYGFKASRSGRAFPAAVAVKPLPAYAPPRAVCIDPSPASATATLAWLSVQASPRFREPLCERLRAALPQGSLAPVRVLLSRSIVAYYDPIRQSRRHAATSRPCRLYAAPSLCGSASATRETFPTFPAVLSVRAVDLAPVGP